MSQTARILGRLAATKHANEKATAARTARGTPGAMVGMLAQGVSGKRNIKPFASQFRDIGYGLPTAVSGNRLALPTHMATRGVQAGMQHANNALKQLPSISNPVASKIKNVTTSVGGKTPRLGLH